MEEETWDSSSSPLPVCVSPVCPTLSWPGNAPGEGPTDHHLLRDPELNLLPPPLRHLTAGITSAQCSLDVAEHRCIFRPSVKFEQRVESLCLSTVTPPPELQWHRAQG